MPLQIQAIAQPQNLEFIFAEIAGQKAPRLLAEFHDAFRNERFVGQVVPIHPDTLRLERRIAPITARHELMTAAACQCLPILVTDPDESAASVCKSVNRLAEPFFGSVQHAEGYRKATHWQKISRK
jgi:hypothetical protein